MPVAAATKRSAAPATHGGIVVYTNGSAACYAMRDALSGVAGIEFIDMRGQPISGITLVPTAVKPNGETWSPVNGWSDGSRVEFEAWGQGR